MNAKLDAMILVAITRRGYALERVPSAIRAVAASGDLRFCCLDLRLDLLFLNVQAGENRFLLFKLCFI
jgi:hypothetical protein